MALDLVVKAFEDASSNSSIQRFFIDFPLPTGRICLIKQVQVLNIDFGRMGNFDLTFGMSLDPDHVPQSLIAADSRMPIVGRFSRHTATSVGFQTADLFPIIFQFPEGLACPYTRLPFFVQHSNTAVVSVNWRVCVLFEFVKLTGQQLAVAVMRRGRGETRRVP